ncbi:MAG: trypsin-like peptidase domain-containing protein [Nitrosomonadales bacterium]|nr:trypsin-like peptidase domain-containing protein [Nitrosomonadales bacterium]
MKQWALFILSLGYTLSAQAVPPDGMVYDLKPSVVKIHVVDPNGNHGVGSGVVVAKDHVATNCHVVANARGVHVTKFGDSFAPVALKADWKHDLCLLKFQGLDLPAVKLGSTKDLSYEQPVFTISFPNNSPKPLTTYGEVKALYPYDSAHIIRATADFRLGGSGGPMFDDNGTLVGIMTMKSPGRNAFYYNIPVDWVKPLLDGPELSVAAQRELPFWDAPEEKRPFFMRVLQPMQTKNWAALETISQAWVKAEPESAEAWYMLGLAQKNLGKLDVADNHLNQAINLNQLHADAIKVQSEIKGQRGWQECSVTC